MPEIKASYLLAKTEILFLMNHFVNTMPTLPALHIMEKYLEDCAPTEAAIEGLVFKRLAHKNAEKLIIEPVVELIIKSLLLVDKLWIINGVGTIKPILIGHTHDLFLLITCYPLMEDTWKITLFPNAATLREEMKDSIRAVKISAISEDGSRQTLAPDNNFIWLSEE